MILDNYLVVSGTVPATGVITGQAFTATALSTDTIDLVNTRDIGEGQDLYMVFTVVIAFTGLTSVVIEAIGATNAALSSGVTVVGSAGTVLLANLTAGATFVVRINPSLYSTATRYLGARYTVSGTGTAGSICAYIVQDIQDGRKFYASGFTVQ